MKTISPQEFQQVLTADPKAVILDVRTPLEYAEVHVPSARNEPLDKLEPQHFLAETQGSTAPPIFLICRSGGRAAKAAEKFARAGFTDTVVIEGGTQAWEAAGLPVIRGTVKVISLERQVRIAAGSLVLTGVLLAYFVHPGFIGLAGFVGAGLVFAGITDWCGMGLLLARLPWNTRKRTP